MKFGISTHLYHDRRLSREHLAEIASYGFEAVEVFATRTHFDYHDPAAIEQLA
jgi:sugar phosphate isomerase/epimerase